MNSLSETFSPGQLALADGAWGSNMIAAGLDVKVDCAERWNRSQPKFVETLAAEFIDSGAEIVTSNTFGGNCIRLARFGLGDHVTDICQRGVSLARKAAGPDKLIAGSMGPTGLKDIVAHAAEIEHAFKEQAQAIAAAGADFLLLETMTSIAETRIALDVTKKSTLLDVVCSFAFTRTAAGAFTTWSGASVDAAILAAQDSGADMVGVNCYPADQSLSELLGDVHRIIPNSRLWLKPNAGAPCVSGERIEYPHPVVQMPISLDALVSMNVGIIGGCCGTTPGHLKSLATAVARFNRGTLCGSPTANGQNQTS